MRQAQPPFHYSADGDPARGEAQLAVMSLPQMAVLGSSPNLCGSSSWRMRARAKLERNQLVTRAPRGPDVMLGPVERPPFQEQWEQSCGPISINLVLPDLLSASQHLLYLVLPKLRDFVHLKKLDIKEDPQTVILDRITGFPPLCDWRLLGLSCLGTPFNSGNIHEPECCSGRYPNVSYSPNASIDYDALARCHS